MEPDNIIKLLLNNETNWNNFNDFITQIIAMKEKHERDLQKRAQEPGTNVDDSAQGGTATAEDDTAQAETTAPEEVQAPNEVTDGQRQERDRNMRRAHADVQVHSTGMTGARAEREPEATTTADELEM